MQRVWVIDRESGLDRKGLKKGDLYRIFRERADGTEDFLNDPKRTFRYYEYEVIAEDSDIAPDERHFTRDIPARDVSWVDVYLPPGLDP